MSKRKQVSREIGHSLLKWSKKVVERSVIKHVYDPRALVQQRMARVMEAEGVVDYDILKVRVDGRCVARAEHPVFGKVVVKMGMPTRNPDKAYTNHYLASLVQQHGEGLFPKIHRVAQGHSVEAWIEGREVAKLDRSAIEAAALRDLLERIKRWSLAHESGTLMAPEDVQEATMRYVRKIVHKLRRKSNAGILQKTRDLYRLRHRLTERLAALQRGAAQVALPQGMALMDIGLPNLMLDSSTGAILVIDYEMAMESHFGFDAAYILHSLYKKNPPAPILKALEEFAFSAGYLGSSETATFFRDFYDVLNELHDLVSR